MGKAAAVLKRPVELSTKDKIKGKRRPVRVKKDKEARIKREKKAIKKFLTQKKKELKLKKDFFKGVQRFSDNYKLKITNEKATFQVATFTDKDDPKKKWDYISPESKDFKRFNKTVEWTEKVGYQEATIQHTEHKDIQIDLDIHGEDPKKFIVIGNHDITDRSYKGAYSITRRIKKYLRSLEQKRIDSKKDKAKETFINLLEKNYKGAHYAESHLDEHGETIFVNFLNGVSIHFYPQYDEENETINWNIGQILYPPLAHERGVETTLDYFQNLKFTNGETTKESDQEKAVV